MLNKLHTRQKNSIQPLIAMFLVLIMPVFVSGKVNITSLISELPFNTTNIDYAYVQFVLSCAFIFVGVLVWLWGSKSKLLRLVLFYTFIATVYLVFGLLALLLNLSSFGSNQALTLMKDAIIIWSMTALTFSLWYWLLDSGWTEQQGVKDTGRQDFLFSQQTNKIQGWENWQPSYVEYLNLAFNTNTAFSPTDVIPLSHRVKVLMMVQSGLALVIISTVAAQAINILST
jgi:hypothetical protein